MKVFVSWSGNSRGTAHAIYKALPALFDTADPWISVENRSGSIWLPEIDKQLSSTDFGIVCVTRENQHAPWLNFEAGALSRRVDAKRELMPVLLLDFESMNDVEGPITGFQMKIADLDGFYDVMKDLNASELGPNISEAILRKRVEDVWPSVEKEIVKIRDSDGSSDTDKRTDSEKIDELLDVARSMARSISPPTWGPGAKAVQISGDSKRILARAIGEAAETFGLGEIVTVYPDEERVLVRSEKPVSYEAHEAISALALQHLWSETEVSYQTMTPSEVENNRSLREHLAKYGSN